MSAYMVDRDHIAYLVSAALSRSFNSSSTFYWMHDGKSKNLHCADLEGASKLGQMLWDENFASVTARYPDAAFDELPGEIGENFVYGAHDPIYGKFDPVQVIKACHCYQYQSCEHEGWEESEACAFIETLIDCATHALPGYDAAAWGAPKFAVK